MARSAYSLLGSEFDGFLFAPIGEERNGMLLSVVSALARRDVDPWQEAAQLALLPQAAATKRLATLITPLPDGSSGDRDPSTIAARLVALLPQSANSKILPHKTLPNAGPMTNFRAFISMVVINAIFVAFMLGAQSIIASHQAPSHADKDHARVSSIISPKIKSSSVDK